MNTHAETAPAGLRIARWYLAAVAALLLGIGSVTVIGHVAQAMAGVTLVFSQDEMQEESPQVVLADETTGGLQFVDLPSLAVTLVAGALAAAGAVALFRRTRWALPLGLAASAVAAGIGLIPAAIGLWAANYYALVDLVAVTPFLALSAVLVAAALFCGIAVWRFRQALTPA